MGKGDFVTAYEIGNLLNEGHALRVDFASTSFEVKVVKAQIAVADSVATLKKEYEEAAKITFSNITSKKSARSVDLHKLFDTDEIGLKLYLEEKAAGRNTGRVKRFEQKLRYWEGARDKLQNVLDEVAKDPRRANDRRTYTEAYNLLRTVIDDPNLAPSQPEYVVRYLMDNDSSLEKKVDYRIRSYNNAINDLGAYLGMRKEIPNQEAKFAASLEQLQKRTDSLLSEHQSIMQAYQNGRMTVNDVLREFMVLDTEILSASLERVQICLIKPLITSAKEPAGDYENDPFYVTSRYLLTKKYKHIPELIVPAFENMSIQCQNIQTIIAEARTLLSKENAAGGEYLLGRLLLNASLEGVNNISTAVGILHESLATINSLEEIRKDRDGHWYDFLKATGKKDEAYDEKIKPLLIAYLKISALAATSNHFLSENFDKALEIYNNGPGDTHHTEYLDKDHPEWGTKSITNIEVALKDYHRAAIVDIVIEEAYWTVALIVVSLATWGVGGVAMTAAKMRGAAKAAKVLYTIGRMASAVSRTAKMGLFIGGFFAAENLAFGNLREMADKGWGKYCEEANFFDNVLVKSAKGFSTGRKIGLFLGVVGCTPTGLINIFKEGFGQLGWWGIEKGVIPRFIRWYGYAHVARTLHGVATETKVLEYMFDKDRTWNEVLDEFLITYPKIFAKSVVFGTEVATLATVGRIMGAGAGALSSDTALTKMGIARAEVTGGRGVVDGAWTYLKSLAGINGANAANKALAARYILIGHMANTGNIILQFNLAGKGAIAPILEICRQKWGESAEKNFFYRMLAGFGEGEAAESWTQGIWFGVPFAFLSRASYLAGQAWSNQMKNWTITKSKAISSVKGKILNIMPGEVKHLVWGTIKEAYIEGPVAKFLVALGVPPMWAEILVEFIPGDGGVRVNRFSITAHIETMEKYDPAAAMKLISKKKVKDIIPDAETLEAAALEIDKSVNEVGDMSVLDWMNKANVNRAANKYTAASVLADLTGKNDVRISDIIEVTGEDVKTLAKDCGIEILRIGYGRMKTMEIIAEGGETAEGFIMGLTTDDAAKALGKSDVTEIGLDKKDSGKKLSELKSEIEHQEGVELTNEETLELLGLDKVNFKQWSAAMGMNMEATLEAFGLEIYRPQPLYSEVKLREFMYAAGIIPEFDSKITDADIMNALHDLGIDIDSDEALNTFKAKFRNINNAKIEEIAAEAGVDLMKTLKGSNEYLYHKIHPVGLDAGNVNKGKVKLTINGKSKTYNIAELNLVLLELSRCPYATLDIGKDGARHKISLFGLNPQARVADGKLVIYLFDPNPAINENTPENASREIRIDAKNNVEIILSSVNGYCYKVVPVPKEELDKKPWKWEVKLIEERFDALKEHYIKEKGLSREEADARVKQDRAEAEKICDAINKVIRRMAEPVIDKEGNIVKDKRYAVPDELEGVNQVQAVLDMLVNPNALFGMPTSAGKTFYIYAAVAQVNKLLGRKTPYVTHDLNQFVAQIESKWTKLFEEEGIKWVALAQESDGDKKLSLNDLHVVGDNIRADADTSTAKKLQDADVVIMSSDVFEFFENAFGEAKGLGKSPIEKTWNKIFVNTMIVFDEVDTIFFKNRAQSGKGQRLLEGSQEEVMRGVHYEFLKDVLGFGKPGEHMEELKTKLTVNYTVIDTKGKAEKVLDKSFADYEDAVMKSQKNNTFIYLSGVMFNKDVVAKYNTWLTEKLKLDKPIQDIEKLDDYSPAVQNEIREYRRSLKAVAKVILQVDGGDVAYDPDSALIVPAPQGVAIPELHLQDPYFAGHTQLLFAELKGVETARPTEDYLNKLQKEIRNEQEKLIKRDGVKDNLDRVTVSDWARVTTMDKAIRRAMNAGATISGFTGTLDAVTDMANLMYGLRHKILGEEFDENRIHAVYETSEWKGALDNIFKDIEKNKIQNGFVFNGLRTVHEGKVSEEVKKKFRSLAKIRGKKYQRDFEIHLVAKDQKTEWDVYKFIYNHKTGEVTEERVFKEITDDNGNIIKKVKKHSTKDIQKYMLKDDVMRKDNVGVFFYLNPSATRATDIYAIHKDDTKLKDIFTNMKCYALIDTRTTSWGFKQLAGRDRGARSGSDHEKFVGKELFGKKIYHHLDVYIVDKASNAEVTPIKQRAKGVKKIWDMFERTDKMAKQEAFYKNVSDLAYSKAAEFLENQKDRIREDINAFKAEVKAIEKKIGVNKKEIAILQKQIKSKKVGDTELVDKVKILQKENSELTSRIKEIKEIAREAESRNWLRRRFEGGAMASEQVKIINDFLEEYQNTIGVDDSFKIPEDAQTAQQALQDAVDRFRRFLKEKIVGDAQSKLDPDPRFFRLYKPIQDALLQEAEAKDRIDLKRTQKNPKGGIAFGRTFSDTIQLLNENVGEDDLPARVPETKASDEAVFAPTTLNELSMKHGLTESQKAPLRRKLAQIGYLDYEGNVSASGVAITSHYKNALETLSKGVLYSIISQLFKSVGGSDDEEKALEFVMKLVDENVLSLSRNNYHEVIDPLAAAAELIKFGVVKAEGIKETDIFAALTAFDSQAFRKLMVKYANKATEIGREYARYFGKERTDIRRIQKAINNQIYAKRVIELLTLYKNAEIEPSLSLPMRIGGKTVWSKIPIGALSFNQLPC
ncbi:hypothetical protein ES705_14260 [subsurface metagenome]